MKMSDLKVTFGQATLASDQLISKAEAQQPLKFYWTKEPGHVYTVEMTDQDALGRDGKPYLHYRAEDITLRSDGTTFDGRVIAGPIPPNPPSGVHRYWVRVYEQPSGEQIEETSFRVAA